MVLRDTELNAAAFFLQWGLGALSVAASYSSLLVVNYFPRFYLY